MIISNLALAIGVAFGVVDASAQETTDSIYDIAAESEDFTTLADAVEAAGLTDALSGEGTYTVFAPPNSAFSNLPQDLVTKLLDPVWQPQLRDVLLHHTLDSEVRSTDISDGLTATTLNGEEITITLNPPTINGVSHILVDDELVDIEASNGVIHAIDTVLTPSSVTSTIVDKAVGSGLFSTLVAAVTEADLVGVLSGKGPFTVFAPTDEAFAALDGTLDFLLQPENAEQLTDILNYHVVAANAVSGSLSSGDVETLNGDFVMVDATGEGVMVNDAKVIIPDIVANNGIIHAIDKVLIPPTDAPTKIPTSEPKDSIYDMAAGSDDFTTLAGALDLAGLAEALSGDGTFTVFAPPNSAFDALSPDLVTKLSKPVWQPQLQDVLQYHTLSVEVRSTDLSDGLTATTLNGEDITITLNPPTIDGNSEILVDEGLIDIEASNGVVHVIERVLAPSSVTSTIIDKASGSDSFSTLVTAVTAAGLADVLSGEGPFTVFAPTDEAFAALPDGTLDFLLQPENAEQLTDILKYHVVAANAASASLSDGKLKTLNGDSVMVDVSVEGVVVNGAEVIIPDIISSNGIIHGIDTVLIPPTPTPTKNPTGMPPTKKPTRKPTSPMRSKSGKSSKSTKSSKASKSSKSMYKAVLIPSTPTPAKKPTGMPPAKKPTRKPISPMRSESGKSSNSAKSSKASKSSKSMYKMTIKKKMKKRQKRKQKKMKKKKMRMKWNKRSHGNAKRRSVFD